MTQQIREYMREYRKTNKTRLAYQMQQRREEWRLKLLKLIGNSICKDCSNTDTRVLQFDHLSDKEQNVSYYLGRNWDKALNEAQKCEVVCANCHVIRTHERLHKHSPTESKWIRLRKEFCPQGHAMTKENIVYYFNSSTGRTARHCIECRRGKGRTYMRQKRREKKHAELPSN